MDRLQRPAAAGLVLSMLTVLTALFPYLLSDLEATEVGSYYDYGLLGGWSVLVVAVVAVVVFASAYQRRSDPATAAGAGLVLGLAATVLALVWAFAVPYGVVVQLPTGAWFEYHRWLLVFFSVGIALAGGWYAATQDLV